MNRSIGAIIALLALCLVTVSVTNVASLNLTSPRMSTTTAADRCTASAEVALGPITDGSTKPVVLSGIDPSCAKKKAAITLFNAQGAAVFTVPDQKLKKITNGEVTVEWGRPVNAASIEGAAMTIDTWGITTTFTKPLPLLSCTIDYVQISTDPAVANATFKLTINLADPALPQPIREMRSDLNRTAGVDDCSSMPIIDLVGPSWGNKTDSAGETFEFFIGGSTGILDPAPQNTILQCP